MARSAQVVLTLLSLAALIIAIIALILACVFNNQVYGATSALDRDVLLLSDQAANITQQIENLGNTPTSGWLAFWWADPDYGLKHNWAWFNPILGLKLGGNIPYTPSETRAGSVFKSQFKAGAEPNSIVFLMQSDRSAIKYMVRHSLALYTYNKTVLGTNPTNHGNPEMIIYDIANSRYIGMATISTQSFKYAVVIVDANTGAITPLTGDTGTLPPTNNFGLDMQIIGNRIYFFERYDDDAQKGHIIWYDRDNGQYLGHSFFQGTFIAYPGTFIPTLWTDSYTHLWYQSVGYDVENSRLHIVLSEDPTSYNRHFAWIQGTDEADLMAKLESGNYDLHLSQNQPVENINAACWIS